MDATAMTDAKIGVEHGDAANANNAPIIKGYKNMLLPLFCGNCFIKTGMLISTAPMRFSPIRRINEVKNIIPYGPKTAVKTRPDSAHKIPIKLKINDMPKTKKKS